MSELEDLVMRNGLCTWLICMLEADDDPRAPAAIQELRRQQDEINRLLAEKTAETRAAAGEPEPPAAGDSGPPAVVIGLKALRLQAETGGRHG